MLSLVNKTDLPKMLNWRNEENVRKVMFSNHLITPEEHSKWWERVSSDETQKWYIFSENEIDLGVVYFTEINKSSAHLGYYFKNLSQYKGIETFLIWQRLEAEAINFAFNELCVESIICSVLCKNQRVIMQHKRFGFEEIKIFEKLVGSKLEQVSKMILKKNRNEIDA